MCFSPTGTTRNLVKNFALDIAEQLDLPLIRADITLPRFREETRSFGPDDLVVVATPTYAGKVPNKLLPYLQTGLVGGGALAVALVNFGNRAFDNSLAELSATLAGDGFFLVGAGAFVARHAFSNTIAADRPDERDAELLHDMADAVIARLDGLEEGPAPEARKAISEQLLARVPGDADAPYYRPVGLDGEPTVFLKAKPETKRAYCEYLGVCARSCPMEAISFSDHTLVPGICIKCHSCVRNCPNHAKYFDDPDFLSHRGMLERDYTRRADSVWFV